MGTEYGATVEVAPFETRGADLGREAGRAELRVHGSARRSYLSSTLIAMDLGLASSRFGSVRCRTPWR